MKFPKLFSQRDDRWKDDKLGYSDTITLAQAGCLVTALAMIARYFGKETDPGKFNKDLQDKDGFMGAYYVWKTLTKIYPDISYSKFTRTPNPVTEEQFSEINRHLAKDLPVLVEVDFNPADTDVDNHFVVLLDHNNGGYDIADSWTGTMERLSKYGVARITIQRYLLYEGDPVQTPENGWSSFLEQDIPTEIEERFHLKEKSWYNKYWSGATFLEYLLDEYEGSQKDNEELKSALDDVEEQLENLRSKKSLLEHKINDKERIIEDLQNQASMKSRESSDCLRELSECQDLKDHIAKRRDELSEQLTASHEVWNFFEQKTDEFYPDKTEMFAGIDKKEKIDVVFRDLYDLRKEVDSYGAPTEFRDSVLRRFLNWLKRFFS